MSTKTIDQRVVQMEFDNRRFEKNVSTTMSSLDKLKQKLNFTGAVKGFDNINSATKGVNMNGLASAVDTVSHRFSALEVMGVTALANITNSAVNAGKRILHALTIQPVTTGFQEYETQINAIQTILANTKSKGTTLDDVNAALDTLNTYADKTIYNFTEMTRNIGTFTAAGVDLDKSVSAIQGIANLAAVSGSTSQQASTAMYQLSQALASGTVKLMDWNSVVNAGMGGEVFQNALKETARIHGVAVDDMIKKNGSFRETLQEGWLTADILTETLEKFTMNTKYATKAEIEANREKLKSIGYTDAQIEGIFELGNTATGAATEVKTFSQLFDTLKESAQSGWTKTWQIIVGDFDEAKSFMSMLSDGLGGIINKMSEWRNGILESALGSKWSQLTSKITEAGISTEDFEDRLKKVAKENGISIDDLIEKYDNLEGVMASGEVSTSLITKALKSFAGETAASSEATKDMSDKLEYFQDVVNRVWRGDFGNMEDRVKALTEAGYDYGEVQALVNKTVDGHKLTLEDLTGTQMKALGYTDEQIKAFKELAKEAEKTGTPLNELIANLERPSGRLLLIESIKNAGQGLAAVFTSIKDAFLDIFPAMRAENISTTIYKLVVALNKFSEKLRVNEDTADKLQRSFKGLFALVDIILTVVGGPLRAVFKAVMDVLGLANVDILTLTATIGDAIVKFRDWIDEHNLFTKALETILPLLTDAAKGIKGWFDGLKDSDNIPRDIIMGLVNGIMSGLALIGRAALEIGKKIVETVKNFLGIHSPSTVFFDIGKNIIQGLINGVKSMASGAWELMKTVGLKLIEVIRNLDIGKVLAFAVGAGIFTVVFKVLSILGTLADAVGGISEMFEGLGDMFKGLGKMMKGAGFMMTSMGLLNIAFAIGILAFSLKSLAEIDANPGQLWNAVGVLAVLSVILTGLAFALSAVNKIGGIGLKSTLALIGIVGALLLLSVALEKLVGINFDGVGNALLALGGVIAVTLGVLALMSALSKGTGSAAKAGVTLLAISAAMLIMVAVIKLVSGMSTDEILRGVAVMAAFGVLIAKFITVSQFAGEHAKKAGSMILKISVAMLIMVGVVKLAGSLSKAEVYKGLGVIAAVELLFIAVLTVARLGGPNAAKAGGLILMMSVALLAVVTVIKLVSGIDMGDIKKGFTVIAGMELLFIAVIAVSKLAGEHAAKVGVTLLAMSAAMMIMVAILFIFGQFDEGKLAKALVTVSVLELLFIGLIAVTKLAKSSKQMMITLGLLMGAVALLAGIVIGMSFIDPKKLAVAAGGMTALLGVFSIMLLMTKYTKNTKHVYKTLLIMVGVIGALALIITALSNVGDPGALLPAAASLSLLLASLSASMVIIGNAKKLKKGVEGNLLVMAAALLAIGVVLSAMSALGVEDAIPNAVALSIILPVLTLCTMLLSTMAGTAGAAAKGALALAVLGVALVPLVGALALMNTWNASASLESVLALSVLLGAMTLCLIPLTLVGSFAGPALLGVVALTAMMVPLFVAIQLLAQAQNAGIGEAMNSVKALSALLTVLTLLLIPLSLVGSLALPAIIGVGVLLLFVTALGAFIVGVGALVDKFPQIQEFLDVGIPILEQLANGIGSIIGNFLGGFLGGVASDLPEIGQYLSDFMDNVQEFVEGAKNVDEQTLLGVGILAGSIAALSVLDLYKSVFLSEDSFAALGTELSNFMKNCEPFITGASTLDANMVEGVKALADAILILTAADFLNGLSNFLGLTEGDALASFGSQLPQFGKDIGAFATSLTQSGLDEDKLDMVTNAATALKILADAANSIPNSGGWVGALVGDNDLGVFAEQFPKLGTGLGDFISNIGDFGDEQMDLVKGAADAIKLLAEASSSIPNQGGWLGAICGENNMDLFSAQFPKLGSGLRRFVSNIGSFSEEQLDTVKFASEAVTILAKAASGIPNQGGWAGAICGENTMDMFAKQFPKLGSGLRGFLTGLGELSGGEMDSIKFATDAVVSLASVAQNIPNSGGWWGAIVGNNDLGAFANQFPQLGSGIRGFIDNVGELGPAALLSSERALDVVEAITDLGNLNISSVSNSADKIGKCMSDLAKDISTFTKKMDSIPAATFENAIDNIKSLAGAANNISSAADSLYKLSDALESMAGTGIDAFIGAFIGAETTRRIKSCATTMMNNLIDGIKTASSGVTEAFSVAVRTAYQTIVRESVYSSFVSAGNYITSGFAQGIRDNSYKAVNAASSMVSQVNAKIREVAVIKSPSRVTYEDGMYMVMGLVNALLDGSKDARNAGGELANSVQSGLSEALARLSDFVMGDFDVQPTIRPVLDLGNIRTGASEINGMLSLNPSVGVLSNINSIGSMMNKNRQNGANDGVISELGKLRKDVSALKHITYNIGGITYGEGSEVANAIETLVRAALIERRV